MADIGLKFCGGCNPLIDRARLAAEVEKLLGPGNRLVRVPAPEILETVIIICGCETACAGGAHLACPAGPARKRVMVSGPNVDLEHVPERDMAKVIVEKLNALSDGSGPVKNHPKSC